jgi:hypothetical protein
MSSDIIPSSTPVLPHLPAAELKALARASRPINTFVSYVLSRAKEEAEKGQNSLVMITAQEVDVRLKMGPAIHFIYNRGWLGETGLLGWLGGYLSWVNSEDGQIFTSKVEELGYKLEFVGIGQDCKLVLKW